MGTAPAWTGVGPEGELRRVRLASVETERGGEAMACHWWPEAQRGAAGVTGVRLSVGRAQHAGVAQLLWSELQQRQAGVEPRESCLAMAGPPCHTVRTARNSPSRIDRLLLILTRILAFWLTVVFDPETLQPPKAKSIFEFAATEHSLAHVRVFNRLPGLQPGGLGHGAVDLVVSALPGFVIGKILNERRA